MMKREQTEAEECSMAESRHNSCTDSVEHCSVNVLPVERRSSTDP